MGRIKILGPFLFVSVAEGIVGREFFTIGKVVYRTDVDIGKVSDYTGCFTEFFLILD